MTNRTVEAPAQPTTPLRLEDFVGDVDHFFTEYWAREPAFLRAQADLTTLISEQEMWDELECGLLSRPYFTVFDHGTRAAIADITTTRTVVGHELQGYADPVQIRQRFAAGGTLKFSQAEHWHPRIRALVKGLESRFHGGLEAFVFLSPPDRTAMSAHTDGAHVLILQVSGTKDWVLGRLDRTSHSDSTLHEGEIPPRLRMERTLRPGDVLYMPHGCPHYATARSGNSIHVAITVEEPTSVDLASVYLAGLLGDRRYDAISANHHTEGTLATIERLRSALGSFLADSESSDVLDKAVNLRRTHR
ncbi:cupin domain-containing protein [Streptomyces sp. NPDC051364]|uniref:JmjC domain-containing protein n=1 Tax=Streptomyces sp. NPDC051364 TaxID=3155799 RepID=UPI003442584A